MEDVHAFTQAQQIKQQHVVDLLKKRNVVGVGLGFKVRQGINTGELGIVVSVTQKVEPAALTEEDLVPQVLNGVKTDVVETGVFRAFPEEAAPEQELGPRDRWRPVTPPGVSVGHYRVTAGTFGCLVQREDEPFLLSNNHVLAASNEGEIGDPILQPGAADGGVSDDRIATLADYVPIDFGAEPSECPYASRAAQLLNYAAQVLGSNQRLEAVRKTEGVNQVDAALGRPSSLEGVSSDILYIGHPTGIGEATLGTELQKTGRTTGYTTGAITQIDATVRVNYNGPTAVFTGQLIAGAMSQPGDSGSAVLDMDKQLVGLLFAGSQATTIINPIADVFSALNVELAPSLS